MAESYISVDRVTYSDHDLLIVPEFTYSFVENYIRNKNKASGNAYLGKGHKDFSESKTFGIQVCNSGASTINPLLRCLDQYLTMFKSDVHILQWLFLPLIHICT